MTSRIITSRVAMLVMSAALLSSLGCGGGNAGSPVGLSVPQDAGGAVPMPRPTSGGTPRPTPSPSATPTQRPSPPPTPSPLPTPTPPPTPPPPPNNFFPDTTVGIHALQVFDEAHDHIITSSQGVADGSRYASVWGVRSPNMATSWHTNNTALNALIYTPFDTDATGSGLDQPTSWWLANHPDWILYECDRSTIAYVSGLPGVPLDISNPAVIAYQTSLLGGFAEANGFNGVAADIVSLENNTGHASSGLGGCGVWQTNHTVWVQKFSGAKIDPAWAAAATSWVLTAHAALHNPDTYSRPLALAINTEVDAYQAPVNGVGGDPAERAVVAGADIVLNESGFSMWGRYVSRGDFQNAVGWMEYAQSVGIGVLVTDDWDQQRDAPTIPQLDYSIATYLMGKEQAAALYVGSNEMYGNENYYSEYGAAIGTACGPMSSDEPSVYQRKFSGGLAVVNVGRSAYVVRLPHPSYQNIEGGQIRSPLTVEPNTGYVLLRANGCV